MIQTASIVVLVCGVLVEILTLRERYLYGQSVVTSQLGILAFLGLMFLVYPLLGHLADVCLNRYRTIKCSFALVISGKTAALTCAIIIVIIMGTPSWNLSISPYIQVIIPGIGVLVSIIGVGLYESNIIQFGLDQLLEAPTPKLIAFIHWYYWAQNVGRLIFFTFTLGVILALNT